MTVIMVVMTLRMFTVTHEHADAVLGLDDVREIKVTTRAILHAVSCLKTHALMSCDRGMAYRNGRQTGEASLCPSLRLFFFRNQLLRTYAGCFPT
jgi:hypothetical protein